MLSLKCLLNIEAQCAKSRETPYLLHRRDPSMHLLVTVVWSLRCYGHWPFVIEIIVRLNREYIVF